MDFPHPVPEARRRDQSRPTDVALPRRKNSLDGVMIGDRESLQPAAPPPAPHFRRICPIGPSSGDGDDVQRMGAAARHALARFGAYPRLRLRESVALPVGARPVPVAGTRAVRTEPGHATSGRTGAGDEGGETRRGRTACCGGGKHPPGLPRC